MTRVFIIHDTVANKISYYHLLAFLAALPFDRFYSQVVFISFILHSLVHIDKKRLSNIFNRNTMILSSVFLLTLVSLIYSQDRSNTIKELTRQIPVLLFPVLFCLSSLDLKRYQEHILKFISFVCSITVAYLFFDALRIILIGGLPIQNIFSYAFVNHNFSEPIGTHATYLSMYVAMGLIISLHYGIADSSKKLRLFYFSCTLIQAAGLVMLASKAVLAALCFILILYPVFSLSGKSIFRFYIFLAIVFIVGITAVIRIDVLRNRYVTEFKTELLRSAENNILSESRIDRWGCALKLIGKSPVYGHGGGAEKKLLQEIYFEQKLYIAYVNALDAHNQFLSFLIKTGLIGLLVFLFVLYSGFRNAWRQRNIFFLSFLVLITTVSMTENILDVNKGIFFYSFFISFFFIRQNHSDGQKTEQATKK